MKTQSLANVPAKHERTAERARACPELVFTALHHHIDLEWMLMAWHLTRRDGAAGVDGVTAAEYGTDLEARPSDLPTGSGPAAAARPRFAAVSSPRGTGGSGRLAFPHWKTRWRSGPS